MVSFLTEFKDSFLAFGGHKQAAGFSISVEKFDDFRARASARAHEIRAGITVGERPLKADMELSLDDVSESLVKEIRSYGPYGMSFAKPAFFFKGVKARVEKLGKDGKHFKLVAPNFSGKINAFGFGQFDKELLSRDSFDLVCEMEVEKWMGRSGIVLTVRDIVA